MHPEDLKVIWICRQCGSSFVFHADVDNHTEQTGHSNMQKNNLLSNKIIDIDT
jgi:hypothetical protein